MGLQLCLKHMFDEFHHFIESVKRTLTKGLQTFQKENLKSFRSFVLQTSKTPSNAASNNLKNTLLMFSIMFI